MSDVRPAAYSKLSKAPHVSLRGLCFIRWGTPDSRQPAPPLGPGMVGAGMVNDRCHPLPIRPLLKSFGRAAGEAGWAEGGRRGSVRCGDSGPPGSLGLRPTLGQLVEETGDV